MATYSITLIDLKTSIFQLLLSALNSKLWDRSKSADRRGRCLHRPGRMWASAPTKTGVLKVVLFKADSLNYNLSNGFALRQYNLNM